MRRIRIAIIFGSEPNFDRYAFKYFILSVNKIQNTFEFSFPDATMFPFEEGIVNFNESTEIASNFINQNGWKADSFISIITNRFDNNWFFKAAPNISIITTNIWEKYFSPPSLFEYLLHSIYSCLIRTKILPDGRHIEKDLLTMDFSSHKDTRGCINDFTRQKYDDKIDIALGYICEEHSSKIKQFYGEDYFKDMQFILGREWIGNIEEKNTVAYNLKHVFKFNINKDSGFNKNFWDKIKDKFYEIPGSLVGDAIKVVMTALLTYLLIKWGIVKIK